MKILPMATAALVGALGAVATVFLVPQQEVSTAPPPVRIPVVVYEPNGIVLLAPLKRSMSSQNSKNIPRLLIETPWQRSWGTSNKSPTSLLTFAKVVLESLIVSVLAVAMVSFSGHH